MEANDKIRFLRNLRAVRNYTPEQIPEDVLSDILEVGRWSGSASNRQGTEVVVVRDSKILQRMSEVGARPAAGATVALVVVTPGGDERHDLNIFDSGRLVERLLLAADAHGVGSNIATLKEDGPDIIKQMLGIPAEKRIWTVVTMGYVDQKTHGARPKNPSAGRKPKEDFVHRDKY